MREGVEIFIEIWYNIKTDVYMETIMPNCYEPDREETIDKILCNRCKHLRRGIKCDAFPNGIPIDIIRSGEHFLPVDGDNGIVFEEISEPELNINNLHETV